MVYLYQFVPNEIVDYLKDICSDLVHWNSIENTPIVSGERPYKWTADDSLPQQLWDVHSYTVYTLVLNQLYCKSIIILNQLMSYTESTREHGYRKCD